MSENANEVVDTAAEVVAETTETTETTEKSAEEQLAEMRAENEKLNKRLGQAEHVIEKTKKAAKAVQVDEPDDIDRKIQDGVRAELGKVTESSLLESVSDPIEREAIRLELEGGIVRTGDAKADFEKARKIATYESQAKVAKEAAVTAKSKAAIVNSGGTSNQDKPTPAAGWKSKLSKADMEYMTSRGWSEEKMKRAADSITQ